jgi:site-specific recombinase XerD
MIEDLQIRNYSPRTIETYVSLVARFARHYGKSPEGLGREDIRSYQVFLVGKGASWTVFNQSVCALKFLYGTTLDRPEVVTKLAYGRKRRPLPVVLSQEEVVQFLGAVEGKVARMALVTAYASGMRVSELVALQTRDIDSARMLLHIEEGKGRKPRLVPLSEVLLHQLRDYWRSYRSKLGASPWKEGFRWAGATSGGGSPSASGGRGGAGASRRALPRSRRTRSA